MPRISAGFCNKSWTAFLRIVRLQELEIKRRGHFSHNNMHDDPEIMGRVKLNEEKPNELWYIDCATTESIVTLRYQLSFVNGKRARAR